MSRSDFDTVRESLLKGDGHIWHPSLAALDRLEAERAAYKRAYMEQRGVREEADMLLVKTLNQDAMAALRADLGWHVISGERLLELMRRAAAGESPDPLYAEEWANADHERVEDSDDS